MKNEKKTSQKKHELAVKKLKNSITEKKTQKTKKVVKKVESFSSESSSNSEVEEKKEIQKTKKGESQKTNEVESSMSESSSSEVENNKEIKMTQADKSYSSSELSSGSEVEEKKTEAVAVSSSSKSSSEVENNKEIKMTQADKSHSSSELSSGSELREKSATLKASSKNTKRVESSSNSSEVEEVSSSVDSEDLEAKDQRVVFIKGLPFNLTEDKLKKEMDLIGKNVRVAIPVTGDGDRNKGFAFVEFVKEKDAEKCLKLDGKEMFGRQITVNMANSGERKKKMTVKVNNLPYKCNKESLMEFFSQFGEIKGCHVPMDEDNRCKGFAFIFVDDEEVFNKIFKNKKKFMDRTLFLKNADQKDSGDKFDIRKRNMSDDISGKRNNNRRRDNNNNRRRDNNNNRRRDNNNNKESANKNKIVFESDSE